MYGYWHLTLMSHVGMRLAGCLGIWTANDVAYRLLPIASHLARRVNGTQTSTRRCYVTRKSSASRPRERLSGLENYSTEKLTPTFCRMGVKKAFC
jgi:hypothetical protein